MTFNNLCSSCTNIGCVFQSGIVRTECAFYMPPHIESDNSGNYVVMPSAIQKTLDKITANKTLDKIEPAIKAALDKLGAAIKAAISLRQKVRNKWKDINH